MRVMGVSVLLGLSLAGSLARAEDCQLGKRYLDLAQVRIAAYANDEAVALLRQSVEACPTYDAYEQLGELAAQSTETSSKSLAVDSFVAAEAHAPTAQAAAKALLEYAKLLDRDGDPQNANVIIQQAKALDPSSQEIRAQADHIDHEVDHPTKASLVRALSYSLYKPLSGASAPYRAKRAAEGGAASPLPPPVPATPSAAIKITFDTGSSVPDAETRPHLADLAQALVDPSLQGKEFIFIGHTDFRGGEQYNLGLSLERAQSIRDAVSALQPSLSGHIRVEGHGAKEPVNMGTDAGALRANRRLQVVVGR